MSHNENKYIRGFLGLKKVNISAINNKDEHNSINDSWCASTGKSGFRGAQPVYSKLEIQKKGAKST